jgi:anaerobic magnesium-protoporphyrin IX monomethyl ester cyclase
MAKTVNIVRFLFLNLPASEQVTRRYMCSYPSPESLLPPIELLSCAAVARACANIEVHLYDAIAEKSTLQDVSEYIDKLNPSFVVTLSGFECYEEDINSVRFLKTQKICVKWIWFGHYATTFPEETLRYSNADFIFRGEPELVLKSFIENINLNLASLGDRIRGIAYIENGVLATSGIAQRINDPNELPMPAYDLISSPKNYYEPFTKGPYAMMQTTRGCPYSCNYCVKSYGTKLAQLSVDRIMEEIKTLKKLHNIRTLRFIDDTFTINKKRVTELCKRLIDEKLNIEWMCLSRTDNINEEMAVLMKKAGCKRIYFGVESGSQRMLNILGKGLNVKEALNTLLMLRKHGIETAGFFLSGHPEETDNDFFQSVRFSIDAKLSFVCFSPIQAYPGTAFFEQVKDKINFSIYPYKLEWIDAAVNEVFSKQKLVFYSRFYMRLSYLITNINVFSQYKGYVLKLGRNMLRYLFWDRRFVIGGIKSSKEA